MRLEARHLDLRTSDRARTVGRTELTDVTLGDTKVTREVMRPGWRWSEDIKPVVGTALCRATHQIYVVSGRLHVAMQNAEVEVGPGDAVVIPPDHDAWVVGDEVCEVVDFSPAYSHLIAAAEAYRALTAADRAGGRSSRAEAARKLRQEARAGRLDSGAVEVVLGAVGHRTAGRVSGPAGLTGREMEVLVLIATGASAKQVAYMLGISPKTAATHIERIYAKAAVTCRAAATRFAIQHGLVNPIP